jgi:phenylpropionate dioxygenase-like ring-hydroxylating dioxygenase large terminal subunit
MKHDKQLELIDLLHAQIDKGESQMFDSLTRIPVETYFSESKLSDEIDSLFKRYPLALGMSHELPGPGHYLTNDRAGVPVLMTRAEDGEVRAFLNVCRHRGAKVVTEEKGEVRKVMSCPYHGWSYGLDGELKHIPTPAAFEDVDRSCHGLRQLPACERHGIVWVQLDPDLPFDVPETLGELDAEIGNFNIGDYHFYERRVIEQPFNWKIAIDTFLEPYHFGVLHRNSIGPLFFHDLCIAHQYGPHLREIMPRKSIDNLREHPREEWDLLPHSVLVYVLFPGTIVVVQIDHVELWRFYPDPTNPAQCTMTMDFLVPDPVETDEEREHWRKNMELLMMTVMDEDFPTGVTIQRGLKSGAQTHVTFGRNEAALAMFELTVAERTQTAA